MADETIQTNAEPEPVAATEPEPSPHPLEPGGKRFEEVYREMKDAQRREMEMRERLARLEGQQQPQAPKQAAVYTVQQLQAAVDAGQITPALMADQLAWQRTEQAKREVKQELEQQAKVGSASLEIQQYIAKMPELLDTSSDRYRWVHRAAMEIADELGRPLSDPIVQRRALREVLGGLDKLQAVKVERDFNRANADTHAEVGGGGGTQKGGDPLKNIDPVRMAFWQKRGYTRKEMEEEARFVTRPVRRPR